MRCPRLKHFVRLNPNGTVGRCGHMVNAPEFVSYEQLESSEWLVDINNKFNSDEWPKECFRCRQTETIDQTSIRLHSIEFDKIQTRPDYLTVGGVLDNICNSACQFCNEDLSTKIGSLRSRDYPIIDNTNQFWQLPVDRIVHLDLNGGEPSASKNYQRILEQLPPNVESIRINTNCSKVIPELELLQARGIEITVTVSFDGMNLVHDYVRWPITWDKFYTNLMIYKTMPIKLNLWTTVNALNVGNLPQMFDFVSEHGFDHSWALLTVPTELSIEYTNSFTVTAKEQLMAHSNKTLHGIADYTAIKNYNQVAIDAYMRRQDTLRNINYKDYLQ